MQLLLEIIGVLTKAITANEQTIIGEEKEAISLAYTACKAEDIENIVTNAELQIELEKSKKNVQVSMSGDDLSVWFKDTGHRYIVKQDGKIEQIGDMTQEDRNEIVDVITERIVLTADGKVICLNTELVEEEFAELTLENGITITEDGVRKREYNTFVDNKGKVYTWGENFSGQLGNGTEVQYSDEPICISDIDGNALNGKNIINIVSDEDTRMAIDDKGKVYAWGDNYCGQIGDETKENSNTPICISDIDGSVLNGKDIIEITTGSCTIALDKDGKVYTWGENSSGVLGDGTREDRIKPVCISDMPENILNQKKIKKIYLYNNEPLAMCLDEEGKVYGWGYNGYFKDGILLDQTREYVEEPRCISDLSGSVLNGKRIMNIFSDGDTAIVIDDEGKVYSWGNNNSGQLGSGIVEYNNMPICISDIEGSSLRNKKIVNIFFKGNTVIAIDDIGKVYSWGDNYYGQIGDETTENRNMPICLSDIEDSCLNNVNITNIHFNGVIVIATDNMGNAYTWGMNAMLIVDDNTQIINKPISITDNPNSKLNGMVISKVYCDNEEGKSKQYYACITDDGKVVYMLYYNAV